MNDPFINESVLGLAQATLLLGGFWAAYGILKFHPRARVMLCRIVSVALPTLFLLNLAPVPPILHLPAHRLPGLTLPLHVPEPVPIRIVKSSQPTGDRLPVAVAIKDIHSNAWRHLPAIRWTAALMLVWFLGSAFLVVRWLVGLMMARRLAASAQEPPAWARDVQAELASRLHLAARVRLGVIDHAGSPLLLGPRPVILLPRHLLNEDAQDDFMPSLAHEMVHVKEFDWWWSQWLQLITAMLWPAAPVWFFRRAHDSAAEIVCDSIAASLAGGREIYAGALARQNLHALGRSRLAGIPMLRRSGMRQRIDLLLSGFAPPVFSRRSMLMTGLLVLLTCGALSSIRATAAADAPGVVAPASASIQPNPAAKEIEPYGGLSWNDGLFQVIQKIKKIEGITSITWPSRVGMAKMIDLTTITTPEELSAALEKRASEYLAPYGGASPNTSMYQNTFSPYKDASGNDKKYLSNTGIIGDDLYAGPIILAGHPFTLDIHFGVYPGFAVKFPDQTINLPDYEGAAAPLAITTVALRTDTRLSDNARNAIIDKLIAKYEITGNDATVFKSKYGLHIDKNGPSSLDVDLVNGEIAYKYENRQDLLDYYQKLLTKLAEAAAKKEPDGINGL